MTKVVVNNLIQLFHLNREQEQLYFICLIWCWETTHLNWKLQILQGRHHPHIHTCLLNQVIHLLHETPVLFDLLI